jgi:histidinol-phosphate/aromatic aminotransferase/cobyric acid decarboxylase-like protein
VRDASNFVGLDGHYLRVAVRTQADNRRMLRELGKVLV